MKSLILVLLWATSCSTVIVTIDGLEVDCSLDCVCCKGGEGRCGYKPGYGDNYCFDGCVDGIFGPRCHIPCRGNCYNCEQQYGRQCYTCKDTFYDTNSECNKTCSVGCDVGSCNNDGTCSPCAENYEGNKCDTCVQGKYGPACTNNCLHLNCRCTFHDGCDSCKTGFYDKSTFCKTPCSYGCLKDVCYDDGSCDCRIKFTGSKCSHCVSSYYGTHCDKNCSVGCVNGICSTDGTCVCRPDFMGAKCNDCVNERYGNYCENVCSLGCATPLCDRNNGSCECLPNFTGDKCDQCIERIYGQSCDLHCSDTCVGGTCSRNGGKCTYGCVIGYSGDYCSTPCNSDCATCHQYDQSYCTSCFNDNTGSSCRCPPRCTCAEGGDKCISCINMYSDPEYQCKCHTMFCGTNCSICINDTYFVHKGLESCCQCPDSCKDTKCSSQFKCLYGCEDGFYGNTCSKDCSDNDAMCSLCLQDNGSCTQCSDGYYLDIGGTCTACSAKCIDDECEGSSGRCIAGCIDGYWGKQCENSCDAVCKTCNGTDGDCIDCILTFSYGPYCNLSCSHSCINSECDIAGKCVIGCIEDYGGERCTERVTTASASGVSVGLTAGIGIIGLVVGLAAASLLAVILRTRRRARKQNNAVLEGQQSLATSPPNTDGNNMYEKLDKKPAGTTEDQQQYEMIKVTNSVKEKRQDEKEREYNAVVESEYYNERLTIQK